MIRSVSFSVSKLDKRVQIRIRGKTKIQSMTGFLVKWRSLGEEFSVNFIRQAERWKKDVGQPGRENSGPGFR